VGYELIRKKEDAMNKILIVDDEKAIRDVLSDTLSFLGYEVSVASNGHEGFSLFLNDSFGLVFTDMHMPDMDGWSLAHHIKDKSPDTPVVLITGSEKETVMKTFKGSFVDTVLFKPLSLEDIQKTVQRLLHSRALPRGSAPSVSDSVSSQNT
jgi:CheY-like chemotaxis protein